MRNTLLVGAAALAATLSGCSTTPDTQTLDGEVFYRERIAIPQDSVVKVALQDTSKMDVAAETLASTEFQAQGGPPYAFSLSYPAKAIKAGMRYTISARIESADGQLMFINTESVAAFGDQPLSVLVNKVAAPATTALTKTQWQLTDIDGRQAELGMGDKAVSLMLSDDGIASGFAGCNRYQGRFDIKPDGIQAGPFAVTQMACPTGMELEQHYLSTLDQAAATKVVGNSLLLMDSDGKVLMSFRAQ
ncbi:META domain-containing protein [Ferrimonas sp. SCSIO 43195]|uniref:META domain-containing protein n=1 Tax=Ferrimonas sp. SCSIO 43195 TaxID=2822844 RepID=UPI0020759F50|nr:META domain-containing protein [Ferrimonas sp. SCSIO 43195]USD35789.1 META domain-containing protein [Ferrimonas sp. SCSIO 43195]